MPEIIWLLEEAVRAIHERQISEHGGSSGLRDEGLLQSALARPQHLLAYGDPPPDAAALAAAMPSASPAIIRSLTATSARRSSSRGRFC
jgi:prophage maintenance system killer protein